MVHTLRLLPLALILGATHAAAATASADVHRFANGQCFYGEPASAEAPARVVDVTIAKHLNVDYGETLQFVNAGKAFTWRFNGLDRRTFDLQTIAPPDFGTQAVEVHVGLSAYNRR